MYRTFLRMDDLKNVKKNMRESDSRSKKIYLSFSPNKFPSNIFPVVLLVSLLLSTYLFPLESPLGSSLGSPLESSLESTPESSLALLVLVERKPSVNISVEFLTTYDSRGYLTYPGLSLIHALNVNSLKSLSIIPRSMKLLVVLVFWNSMS